MSDADDANASGKPRGLPRVGELFAEKYRIERVLGQGGMGVVMAAHHVVLEQRVAIKFLLPDCREIPGAESRFLREARAASRIQNEHVARVLDVGLLDQTGPYMVMEYLTGTDLAERLAIMGALPVGEGIDYVLQACEAIAEAHAIGIVHRDLKPSNLFMAKRPDGSSLVKLLDFGIAKAPVKEEWTEGSLTTTGAMVGSPLYMSPEQIRTSSTVDARTDIWSLGIILHELLSGHCPFENTSPAALCAVIAADPPLPLREHRPDAPAELEAVILKCLAKDVRNRFQSVSELAAALRPFTLPRSRVSLERIASLVSSIELGATVATDPSYRPAASGPATLASEDFRTKPVDAASTRDAMETKVLPENGGARRRARVLSGGVALAVAFGGVLWAYRITSTGAAKPSESAGDQPSAPSDALRSAPLHGAMVPSGESALAPVVPAKETDHHAASAADAEPPRAGPARPTRGTGRRPSGGTVTSSAPPPSGIAQKLSPPPPLPGVTAIDPIGSRK